MVSLPEDFIPNITPDEVEKVLTDPDWEDKVAEASLLAVTHCSNNPKESDAILAQVISYNVTKKIRELYLEKANPLPKEIIWDNKIDNVQAYELLEYIVLQFCLMREILKENKPHTMSLYIDNELIEIRLKNWCIQLEELYTNNYKQPVKIEYKKLKTKYTITLK
jgi:hypothetical protein